MQKVDTTEHACIHTHATNNVASKYTTSKKIATQKGEI